MILPPKYTLITKEVRHARIRVSEDHGVRIILPKNFSTKDLENLLKKKQKWISKNLDFFKRKSKNIHLKENEILFLGQIFKQILTRTDISNVDFNNNIIYSPQNLKTTSKRLKWYKYEAKKTIKERADFYAILYNYTYNRIFIRNQRTKWGSCSAKKNLSFNWRLILCPLFVIDYLVCHELVHTLIMKHNKLFWLQLKSIYKDTEKAQKWLKEYSNTIFYLSK